MSKETTSKDQAKGINWDTAIFIGLFHLGAVAALFMFNWRAIVVAIVLWWITASLGVGMGFHRLLTHRGYKTPKIVEYLLSVCGALALEGGHIQWVVTHRIHHAHTDAPGDPHTPRDGGWWSHIGWMLKGKAQAHDSSVVARYAPDLVKDRFHVLLNRFYWVPLVVLGMTLLGVGGWAYLMWGIFFRVTFNLHATWLVNSATHMWGKRRFATQDDSKNNWWVAILTFGEGWHNNHHAHPTSARHGLAWYEIDLNWWGIRAMQFLRLARAVKLVRLRGTCRRRGAARHGASMNTSPPFTTSSELDVSPIILVVEDVHETRDGIEKLLIADGYRVALARDERDAIESAHRTRPDLILVSLAGLPLEVVLSARSIRRRAEVGEKVPVVVFCIEGLAEGEEVEIEENVYLTRPDNFNQLRRFITRLLNRIQTPLKMEVIQPPPSRISSL